MPNSAKKMLNLLYIFVHTSNKLVLNIYVSQKINILRHIDKFTYYTIYCNHSF